MRLLSTILAFLVLFLTVQPACGSTTFAPQTDSCCEAGCADAPEHHEGDEDEDEGTCRICNPFQSCGCCVGFTTIPAAGFALADPLFEHQAVQWAILRFQVDEAPAGDFWQPPRQG